MAENKDLIISTPRGEVFTYKTKSGQVKARLVWAENFGTQRTNQFSTGQKRLDLEVMKQLEPYMQLDTGAMIMSMRLATIPGSGNVRVNAPYSRKVFYSNSAVGRITGALRGPYYFNRMKADKLAYLRRFVGGVMGVK
ncbi:MAG: hypothetical protein ACK5L3_11505 [Oscillospiraceae bacterium]